MSSFRQLCRRFSCVRGKHRGKNFCIYCGAQLASEPFFSFRVLSSDEQLNIRLKALNEHHAKRQLQDRYPSCQLTAQRVADDSPNCERRDLLIDLPLKKPHQGNR